MPTNKHNKNEKPPLRSGISKRGCYGYGRKKQNKKNQNWICLSGRGGFAHVVKNQNGRKCELSQTNGSILIVYSQDGKSWKVFSISYEDLSRGIANIIPEMERQLGV